uniref:Glycosyltransferase n=1 Tax=Prevotella sp. GTC17262 TaxID=3236797 RepID=A0AB33JKH6_9BACT
MRRNVLFIIGTLQSGGVSKSMISLLNTWNCEVYNTSLCICSKKDGIWEQYIPDKVKKMYDPIIEHVMGGFRSACWLGRHGHILLMLGVVLRLFLSKISRSKAALLISKMMPRISSENYDLIVDYGGQQLLYYMVDKLNGNKKITFFHNDYSKWPYYYEADQKYYQQVDHIFSISQICVDALKRYFPDCKDKISVMENITSPFAVKKLAQEIPGEQGDIDALKTEGYTILCTVAHFCCRKGSDFSIEAAEILHRKKIKFKWLFVGKVLEPDLTDIVKEKRLEEDMWFLGIKSNPYPYMELSNIYIQPSRYEGKSISLDEAKILCKPIVVTNFSTVNDQFENRVNASICEMDGRDLADKIEELINDEKLRNSYINYLEEHVSDNSSEVNKLYKFL